MFLPVADSELFTELYSLERLSIMNGFKYYGNTVYNVKMLAVVLKVSNFSMTVG